MTVSKMMLFFSLVAGVMIALVPHILWLLSSIVGRVGGFRVSYPPFGWSALGLVLLFWSVMAYGYFIGRWRISTTEMEYSHNTIPKSYDGFRIVHISDLHLSTFDDRPDHVQKIVDRINELEPDLVCFTGDMVTTGVEEAIPYTSMLKSLKSRYGVVSVLGNHDFLIYSHTHRTHSERENGVNEFVDYQKNTLGWKVLRNENISITDESGSTISVIGVDNINGSEQGFRTIERGDLAKAMTGVGEGFRILLSHDPAHWSHQVVGKTDIPLTLSGHTHAAQIKLFGWNPSSLMFDHTDGRYDLGDQTLYVNIGLGCTAPFRFGATPEITLITLHPSPHPGE